MSTEETIKKLWQEISDIRSSKQSDYRESWREMRPIGITDIISVKIQRIKAFEDSGNLYHESIEDSLKDIINYCFFRLIKLREMEEAKYD